MRAWVESEPAFVRLPSTMSRSSASRALALVLPAAAALASVAAQGHARA
jgi:hypothetical protein